MATRGQNVEPTVPRRRMHQTVSSRPAIEAARLASRLRRSIALPRSPLPMHVSRPIDDPISRWSAARLDEPDLVLAVGEADVFCCRWTVICSCTGTRPNLTEQRRPNARGCLQCVHGAHVVCVLASVDTLTSHDVLGALSLRAWRNAVEQVYSEVRAPHAPTQSALDIAVPTHLGAAATVAE